MSTYSSQSARITDWLESVCGDASCPPPVLNSPKDLALTVEPSSTRPLKRRSFQMDDRTPKAKRQNTGINTPSASDQDAPLLPPNLNRAISNGSPTREQSTTSRTSNSRASSPNKRGRSLENDFSKPEIKRHNPFTSQKHLEDMEKVVPRLKELRDLIAETDGLLSRMTTEFEVWKMQIDGIHANVGLCIEEEAHEEAWSDLVVHPALLLAEKLCDGDGTVKVINVKPIKIEPPNLLPVTTFTSSGRLSTRRIDYTIGLQFADEETTHTVRTLIPGLGRTLNQTTHRMTSTRVLCSHLEIKVVGSAEDGIPQLSIWTSAGFQKLENLWLHRHRETQPIPALSMAPIPLWQWRENNVFLYIAVMDSAKDTLHILHEKQYVIESQTASLQRVVLAMAQVMKWGHRHYLPWFKEFIGFRAGEEFSF